MGRMVPKIFIVTVPFIVMGVAIGVQSSWQKHFSIFKNASLKEYGADGAEDWERQCSIGYKTCRAEAPTTKSYSIPEGNLKLRHVQLVARHGDRIPSIQIAKDHVSWSNDIDSHAHYTELDSPLFSDQRVIPEELPELYRGVLTFKGQHQLYQLGHSLREVYVYKLKYMPVEYSSDLLTCRSTSIGRTYMSAKSLLHGLYPLEGNISVTVVPRDDDELLHIPSRCPRAVQYYKELHETPDFVDVVRRQGIAMEEFKRHIDVPLETFYRTIDAFVCRACHGFRALPASNALPGSTVPPDLISQMCILSQEAEHMKLLLYSGHDGVLKLMHGPILKKILNHMLQSMLRPLPAEHAGRMDLIVAHDLNIMGLHGILSTRNYNQPAFAANMIFEVWSPESAATADDDSDEISIDAASMSFVRILYDGNVVALPWCTDSRADGLCPISDFITFAHGRISYDWSRDCGL